MINLVNCAAVMSNSMPTSFWTRLKESWSVLMSGQVQPVAEPTVLVSAPPTTSGIDWRAVIITNVIKFGAAAALTYFSVRLMVRAMDDLGRNKKQIEGDAKKALIALGVGDANKLDLTTHELMIATNLVSQSAGIEWDQIGGHQTLKIELQERLILPLELLRLDRPNADLLAPPKGVLLYGPPGCGKTLLARAIAKAANARFINLQMSVLFDKWYGESQKITAAIFSLAAKIQPCIIFIDEIDSFLRSRAAHDHEATALMKAQFMSLWDGFVNDPTSTVIVMGATNRPHDVDDAIRRRMPARFYVDLPDLVQRADILKVHLAREQCAADVDFNEVAAKCDGMSGSDLKEVCRMAVLHRAREILNRHGVGRHSTARLQGGLAREPLTQEHLLYGVEKMHQSNINQSQGEQFWRKVIQQAMPVDSLD